MPGGRKPVDPRAAVESGTRLRSPEPFPLIMRLFGFHARPRWSRHAGHAACIALAAVLATAAQAAVTGRVVNRTTNQPEAGVFLTLISFGEGMDPIEEVKSGPGGDFRFEKPLGGTGMIRAEYGGVSYTHILPPGQPTEDIDVEVFEVVSGEAPPPMAHVMLFETDGPSLVVTESFIFENDATPPKTYRDAERGTLRFFLPPAANGQVDVRATGPASMPLRSAADPTSQPNVYKVDFPLKPGENRIDLNYSVPFPEDGTFAVRVVYKGVSTRLAVPPGMTLESEGLTPMGNEPRTKASLYELEGGRTEYQLKITGEGRLQSAEGSESPPATGSPNRITVQNAPIHSEYIWILLIAGAILGIGFFRLYTATPPAGKAASDHQPVRAGANPAGKPKPSRRKR